VLYWTVQIEELSLRRAVQKSSKTPWFKTSVDQSQSRQGLAKRKPLTGVSQEGLSWIDVRGGELAYRAPLVSRHGKVS
jgi:hypothetical protein